MRLRAIFYTVACSILLASIVPAQEMDRYYIGFLRRGPKWTAESTPETQQIQAAHMAHIGQMAGSGKLVGAGPFSDGGQLRGVFIFKVASLEEAKALAEADPAVKAGRLAVDLHSWTGPGGVGAKYAEWRKANPQAKDEMVTYQMVLLARGPKWAAGAASQDEQLKLEHYYFLKQIKSSDKLVSSGPFTDGGDLREMVVLQAASPEEAKALMESHPSVKSGKLSFEVHPWWVAKGTLP